MTGKAPMVAGVKAVSVRERIDGKGERERDERIYAYRHVHLTWLG